MTQQETDELRLLELNMKRLTELTQRQASLIADLRREIAHQRAEMSALQAQLAEALQRDATARVALSLASDDDQRAEARAYLDEVIKEIECCIRQLGAI